jgi:hypothetical protein
MEALWMLLGVLTWLVAASLLRRAERERRDALAAVSLEPSEIPRLTERLLEHVRDESHTFGRPGAVALSERDWERMIRHTSDAEFRGRLRRWWMRGAAMRLRAAL